LSDKEITERSGAESLLQTVVASNIEVSFANFGTTEVPLVAAFDSIGGAAAAPQRC
jgi:acetolactate synthase-1/2/3 large subunit